MHRFFLLSTPFSDEILFPPDTARQIVRVLRLRSGQTVTVLDNQGQEMDVELDVVGEQVRGRCLERRPARGEPRFELTLYLALCQREKFEWMLQKCTEAGATAFVPLVTSRSLVQETAEVERKRERWERILMEAAEQSHRGRIPRLLPAAGWAPALRQAQAAGQKLLIPWEEEHTLDLRTALPQAAPAVGIFIGPEGGFSAEEVRAAQAAGALPVTLGPRILRMETAALAATVLVLYQAGEI